MSNKDKTQETKGKKHVLQCVHSIFVWWRFRNCLRLTILHLLCYLVSSSDSRGCLSPFRKSPCCRDHQDKGMLHLFQFALRLVSGRRVVVLGGVLIVLVFVWHHCFMGLWFCYFRTLLFVICLLSCSHNVWIHLSLFWNQELFDLPPLAS